jgi:hypothetical protein
MFTKNTTERPRHEIRVLDKTGDTALATWDPELEAEVEAAMAVFTSLRAQGNVLERPDGGADSATGEAMTVFDPSVELYIVHKPMAGG